ncbi:MAG: hypothetical protein KDB27_27875 [Planctomycetales bacterium]|nr:hypothetical protein [Planctomycetales bacterium]
MNDSSENMNDPLSLAAKLALQQNLNRQQTWAGLVLIVVSVAALFVLPNHLAAPFDAMCMGFGSAAIFTVFLYLFPEALRSRGGSLVSAVCLVVALWLMAALTAVVLLIG